MLREKRAWVEVPAPQGARAGTSPRDARGVRHSPPRPVPTYTILGFRVHLEPSRGASFLSAQALRDLSALSIPFYHFFQRKQFSVKISFLAHGGTAWRPKRAPFATFGQLLLYLNIHIAPVRGTLGGECIGTPYGVSVRIRWWQLNVLRAVVGRHRPCAQG